MKRFTAQVIKNIGVIVLILFCIILLSFSIIKIKNSYRAGNLSPNYTLRKYRLYNLHNQISVNSIESWMTFNYINIAFKLDSNYLKNNLNIQDPRYPNIVVSSYARSKNINSDLFLQEIKQSIINLNNTK